MIRHARIAIAALLLACQAATTAGSAQADPMAELAASLPPGIVLTPLAGSVNDWPAHAGGTSTESHRWRMILTLERLPLAPGEALTVERRVESGPHEHLYYVEAGTVAVGDGVGDAVYGQGDAIAVRFLEERTAPYAYRVRNGGEGCASVLRLATDLLVGAGDFPPPEGSGPQLPAASCGVPETVVVDTALPAPRTYAFLASVRWERNAGADDFLGASSNPFLKWHTHPGPVVLLVEAGTLTVSGREGQSVVRDGWVELAAGAPHSVFNNNVGGEPTEALMAGVVAAERDLLVPWTELE